MHEISLFDLSFCSSVMKIYPFSTLHWVNKDENIKLNKFCQPTVQYISAFTEKKFIV